MSRPFYRISLHHLRFAFKLTFAIALSLAIGFGFDLDMPRWAVVTAIIITTAPAFIAGGEPFTGALRHRGLLRFAGTIIGCSSALIIVWVFIWSPLTILIIGAVWAGVCCYAATVIRIENSYALGLAGITALTIVSAIYLRPEMGAILAWFRVSEVFECELPQDEDLSLIHERLREAAQLILKTEDEPGRRLHIERLKKDICIYRDKLYVHGVATEIVENVERLAALLTKYKRVLIVE